jgi:hypothetical protein
MAPTFLVEDPKPLLSPNLFDFSTTLADDSSDPLRRHRIRLFRIQPGFLSEPVGIDDDPAPTGPDDGPNWLQLTLGNDNPFFDLRRPGDPGGIGYSRLATQAQLIDTPRTAMAFGLQAVAPAGRESNGVGQGPTVMSPSFGFFHLLDDGTAFQAFLGRNVSLAPRPTGQAYHASQYGLAVQRPLAENVLGCDGHVYWFIEALGRYRYASDAEPAAVWEFLPGVHWRVGDNVWLSGAYVMPVANPSDRHFWQITCSFQF